MVGDVSLSLRLISLPSQVQCRYFVSHSLTSEHHKFDILDVFRGMMGFQISGLSQREWALI